MGFWNNDDQPAVAANQYRDADDNTLNDAHQANTVHELLGGAAAFEAAKAWEDRKAGTEGGPPRTHKLAKELLAGVAGVWIDREVETRGLDKYDEIRGRKDDKTTNQTAQLCANQHIDQQLASDYAPGPDGAYIGGNNY